MDVNNRVLYFVLMDETDSEVALMVVHFWRIKLSFEDMVPSEKINFTS